MIYLDYNATAPLQKTIKQDLIDLIDGGYNASSLHSNGRKARYIVESTRKNILKMLGLDEKEFSLVFTSGGTESNNLVINNFKAKTIITSPTDHLSILNCRDICEDFRLIELSKTGLVNLDYLENILKSATHPENILVSVIYANNETGIIEQVKEISDLCKKYHSYFHTDAVQVLGKIDVDFQKLNPDFITLSGHKIGAPIGLGILVYKKKIDIQPIFFGGGQEKNLRSGTENIIAIKGFEKALEKIKKDLASNIKRMKFLRDLLEEKIISLSKNVKIIGKDLDRLPNTSNIISSGVSSEQQIIEFDLNNIAISSGSACSSGKIGKSHVLMAMGIDPNDIGSSIRVSIGPENCENDINKFVEVWKKIFFKRKIN